MSVRGWFSRKPAPADRRPSVSTGVSSGFTAAGEPVKMAGTTTVGAEAAAALFAAHGLPDGGVLEQVGHLVPEPGNATDPGAVAVDVEGARVGYLPGHLANLLDLAPGHALPCQVQLWAAPDRGRLRAVGWVAYGDRPATWPHTPSNPPAITVADQRTQRAAATTAMVDDALGGRDPARAAQFKRGLVGAHHYLETVEPIKQLKREGRLEEALALCYAAIDGAERDRDGREPAPWYTEQAAIMHRKRGEHDQEVAVLQRWLRMCPADRRAGSKIQERLDKLQAPG